MADAHRRIVVASNRRGERLQPPRLPFCLSLGIYERHGDGAAHQHNDPAHEEAGVESVERDRGGLNHAAHNIGCEQAGRARDCGADREQGARCAAGVISPTTALLMT